jgi:hypothetical protein
MLISFTKNMFWPMIHYRTSFIDRSNRIFYGLQIYPNKIFHDYKFYRKLVFSFYFFKVKEISQNQQHEMK